MASRSIKRSMMKVGGGGYLSSHDPRVVLGIGGNEKFDWMEIQSPGPSTLVQRFTDLPLNRYVSIVEGDDKWR